ncbi:MAG: hypothetical protein Q4A40_05855 [Bacillota bacterium]|nr:hypothetical protein [Bacillota bacterium]
MNDVAPILLESVQKYFDMWFYADKEVKKIYKKVQNGTATFEEMKRFSERAGYILNKALEAVFTADKLPDGKLYQNIAEKVITPMLKQNHELISEACGYVADDMNKAAGIGITAVTATFNAGKAETVARIASNCNGVKAGNKAAQLVENAVMSMVDDFIRVNLEFQKELGLAPRIQRIYHGGKNHCEFCASLQYSGEYNVPEMPDGIFRRHRSCRCTLIYSPQKGQYQDPWSKKESDDYSKLVSEQRAYLSELDKMSPSERKLARNARKRVQRRSQYSVSEWADRKAQQRIIAENRAAGKEYRAITQEKILKEKDVQKKIRKERAESLVSVEKSTKNAIIKMQKAIDFFAGPNGKILPRKYAKWIGENMYYKYMQAAEGEEAKKYIRTAYRKTSLIGNGGTADVRRFEKQTRIDLGRNNNNHAKKVEDLIRQLEKSLMKPMSDKDRLFLESELAKLKQVK